MITLQLWRVRKIDVDPQLNSSLGRLQIFSPVLMSEAEISISNCYLCMTGVSFRSREVDFFLLIMDAFGWSFFWNFDKRLNPGKETVKT